jgi:CubicO group peptidase (beta-lactamase class C family)
MNAALRPDPAFARLAEVFAETVARGQERGALAVVAGGRLVLDVRGGAADPATGRPWEPDTLVCCFSVTKGVFSLLAHRLIDTGRLDPERAVAHYWPEFAAAGKEAITVAEVMAHRAGLPAVSGAARPGDLYDPARMAALLAASTPVVPPRAAPVYHNMTYGHLLGTVMTRATGRALPELLAEELTDPLDAAFHIGLDAAAQGRCARLTQDDPQALFRALREAPGTLFARSMRFFADREDFNTPRWRGAVIGSGSGHATAAGLAWLYAQLILPGGRLSPERQRAARQETGRSDGPDPVLGIPLRYGAGFELSLPPGLDFGPGPDTLGHWGAGGATAFADPAAGIALAYVTGRMDPAMGSSPRARALVAALYDCLGARP